MLFTKDLEERILYVDEFKGKYIAKSARCRGTRPYRPWKINLTQRYKGNKANTGSWGYYTAYWSLPGGKKHEGAVRKITFIDTPGHGAFIEMRSHSIRAADLAVLVVASDDGSNTLTKELHKTIVEAKIPFMIAFTKCDLPNANIEKAKQSLAEHQLFVEGYGGDVPFTAVSGITKEGIPELLDTILLLSDLQDLAPITDTPEGVVIESNIDSREGISATIIVRNGTFIQGKCMATKHVYAPLRSMKDEDGKSVKETSISQPIRIVGFNAIPKLGDMVSQYDTKKEAEKSIVPGEDIPIEVVKEHTLTLILKADALGALAALKKEIEDSVPESSDLVIVKEGVGPLTESDMNYALNGKKRLCL